MNQFTNIDDKFNYFQESLTEMFEACFPLIKKSRKRATDKKWMTASILQSIRHKDRLYNGQHLNKVKNL